MPKKITALTQEQKNIMPLWAQKWINIGLRCGDVDWETFDKFMPICYKKANLPYPTRVVRVPSPIYGALVASVSHEIWNKRYKNRDVSVRASVGDSVADSVGASVRDSVGDSGYEKTLIKEINKIAKKYKVKPSWNYWLGGQFWVGGWWGPPSYVSFFTEVCGLDLGEDMNERAEAYSKVCQSVNYIWPNRDFILVCDRPKHIHRDEKGRLHSLSEKAIEYKDGWGLFMINGVRFMEEEWCKFTSGNMEAIDIMNEKNQDKKRVMIMNYGNEKLIKELKAKELSRERDAVGFDMVLWKIERKNEEPMVFYEGVDNSKNEKVYLRLPPEFETRRPIEAKLWTFKPLWEEYQRTGILPEFIKET